MDCRVEHQSKFTPRAVYSFSRPWRGSVMKDFDMLVSYQYAVNSRLTSADLFSEPVCEMSWDADSNRIAFRSSEGGEWTFMYDTTAGIPAVIEEATSGGSVHYVRELNGSLIARISRSGESEAVRFPSI